MIIKEECLIERAEEFESVIYDHACDAFGIVRINLLKDSLQPLCETNFQESLDLCPEGVTPSEFIPYEDAGMATGAMLAAASLRSRTTGEARAGEKATRMFAAIRAIYQLGETQEEGYFPKPYGGQISRHFSRDQYLFALLGLREYAPIATVEEVKEIRKMVAMMTRFWMKRHYRVGYFNLPPSNQLEDYMGPLFLGIVAIACELVGEDDFFGEYLQLAVEKGLAKRSAETLFSLYRSGVRYDGGTYLRQNEHSIMMKAITLDCLWGFDKPRLPVWKTALHRFWKDDIPVGVDLNDGLLYHILRYDSATDSTHLTMPGHVPDLENPLDFGELTWGGLRKRAGSVQSAHSAFVVASRLGIRDAAVFGSTILSRLTLSSFTGIHVPDESHIPPGKEWEPRLIRTGYVAMWLWAYWTARARGVLLPVEGK